LVLGHGASGGVEAVDLRAVRDGAVAAGLAVVRVTQPHVAAGRRSPAPAAQLDAAWLAVSAHLHTVPRLGRLPAIHGGRSAGARVACRTATATAAVGIVALAFPVHPPGRPDKSRLDELALPTVPVLVVQGDRDAFGMPPKARGRTVRVIAGADHSLRKDPAAVADAVVEFATAILTQ
jgi:predicted alpha/beta-hydrolase family hydrolase